MGSEKTLRELLEPEPIQHVCCIIYPEMITHYELKEGLINQLPIFGGSTDEDPYNHLKDFYMVCKGMKPIGVTDDQLNLRAFPFSLRGKAKEWLRNLLPGSIKKWCELERLFVKKFFSTSKANSIRKEIREIQQGKKEKLCEYWERFTSLCSSFPHHQISIPSLCNYFYYGLLTCDRNSIDAAAGGALLDKTPSEAMDLFAKTAENSKLDSKEEDATNHFEQEMREMSYLVAKLSALVNEFAKSKFGSQSNNKVVNYIGGVESEVRNVSAINFVSTSNPSNSFDVEYSDDVELESFYDDDYSEYDCLESLESNDFHMLECFTFDDSIKLEFDEFPILEAFKFDDSISYACLINEIDHEPLCFELFLFDFDVDAHSYHNSFNESVKFSYFLEFEGIAKYFLAYTFSPILSLASNIFLPTRDNGEGRKLKMNGKKRPFFFDPG